MWAVPRFHRMQEAEYGLAAVAAVQPVAASTVATYLLTGVASSERRGASAQRDSCQ